MRYFLGIDVSTTASKAIVIDESGSVVATHSVLHDSFSVPSQPLWSEQNPTNWWLAASSAIKKVLESVSTNNIECVSLTGQMQGLVLLDKNHQVLRPAILWNDQRSSSECDVIEQQLGSEFLNQHIGSKILPCHLLSKLMWIKNNEPDIYAQIAHIMTPKDYVRFCMSGVLAVDESDASGFALMDVAKRKWSTKILESQNIPESWLPKIFASTAVCAKVNDNGSKSTNLPVDIPIATGAGDQPAQSIGCGMVNPGAMSLQIGTSGVVTQIGNYAPAPDGSYLDYCHAESNHWIAMGLTAAAAGSFRWFRENIAQNKSFKELDEMASTVSAGSDGLIFIPDICGNIHPHGNALARGNFIGLTERHTLAHMARAVLEGVAFSMREIAELMCSKSGYHPDSYIISGGAANSPLWKKIFADIMQKPIYTVNTNEGAAYGAAIIAGVAAGFWPNLKSACDSLIEKSETIHPSEPEKQLYQDMYCIWREAYPQLENLNAKLTSLQGKSAQKEAIHLAA